MRLVVLKGKQSLSDEIVLTAPFRQRVVVGPQTGLVSLLVVVWDDNHALVYVGHKVHHSSVPLEQLRQKTIYGPLFKVKVHLFVVHGAVRLHWRQLIWACV